MAYGIMYSVVPLLRGSDSPNWKKVEVDSDLIFVPGHQ